MTDEVYIKNKQRARGAVNSRARAQNYQPEYVKHDIKPVPRVPVEVSDQLYSQREEKPLVVGSRKPILQKPLPRPNPPPRPRGQQVSVGNHDHTWYDEQQEPESIRFDEVPSPPQQLYAKESWEQDAEGSKFIANSVVVGDYCVVVNDEVVWSSPHLEEIEEAVQIILYEKKAATLAELSIFKRLPIKIGVSVRDV